MVKRKKTKKLKFIVPLALIILLALAVFLISGLNLNVLIGGGCEEVRMEDNGNIINDFDELRSMAGWDHPDATLEGSGYSEKQDGVYMLSCPGVI